MMRKQRSYEAGVAAKTRQNAVFGCKSGVQRSQVEFWRDESPSGGSACRRNAQQILETSYQRCECLSSTCL